MYDFSNWNLPAFGVDVNQMTNKVAMYLLKKSLGRFLIFPKQASTQDLNPDFEMALKSGKLTLRRLKLNIKNIDEQLMDSPFEVNKGHIDSIDITVPWYSIYTEPCQIQLKGLVLELSLRPKKSTTTQNFDENQYSSQYSQYKPALSSSAVIANEFLNEEYDSIYESTNLPESRESGTDGKFLFISGLIEKLIANLKFSINEIQLLVNQPIDLKSQDSTSKPIISNKISINLKSINCLNEIPGETNLERDNESFFKVFTFQGFTIELHEYKKKPITLLDFSFLEKSSISIKYTKPGSNLTNVDTLKSNSTDNTDFLNGAKVKIQANFQKIRCVISPDQFQLLIEFGKAVSRLFETVNCTTDLPTTKGLGVYFSKKSSNEQQQTKPLIPLPSSLTYSTIDWQVKVEELDFKILFGSLLKPEIDDLYTQYSHLKLSLNSLRCDGELISSCSEKHQPNQHLRAEFNLSNITLDEWLSSVEAEISEIPPNAFTSQRDVYVPILMSDLDLPNSTYLFEKFKLFGNNGLVKLNPRTFTGLKSFWTETNDKSDKASNSTEDASLNSGLDDFLTVPAHDIRLHLEMGKFNRIDAEVRPMWLRVDVRLIDRLEKFIEPFLEADTTQSEPYPATRTPALSPFLTHKLGFCDDRMGSSHENLDVSSTLEHLILHDLDQHNQEFSPYEYSNSDDSGSNYVTSDSWDVKLTTSFLRIVILTPCGILAGSEHAEQNNQRFSRVHHNFWIMDIKEPSVNYPVPSLSPHDEAELKLKVQYKGLDISLFLGLEGHIHTFLVLGQGPTPHFKDDAPLLPGLTVQMNNLSTSGLRSPLFEFKSESTLPVPFPAMFKGFKEGGVKSTGEGNDSDDKDLELSHQMHFRQNVIETSRFVVECDFPIVNIKFTKRLYDLNQFLVNDISSWEPNFTKAKVEPGLTMSRSYMNRSGTTSFYTAKDYSERTTFTREAPLLRFNGDGIDDKNNKDMVAVNDGVCTLLSLVVTMPHLNIQLDFDGEVERDHTISMSQCNFFSATKLNGLAQNYITINTELLYLSVDSYKKTKSKLSPTETDTPDRIFVVSPTPAQRPSSKGCFSVTLFSKLETASSQIIKDVYLVVELRGLDLTPPLTKFSPETPFWFEDLADFGSGDLEVNTVNAMLLRSKVQIDLKNISVVVNPPNHPSQLVVLLEKLIVTTTVFAPDPAISALVGVAKAKLLLSKIQDLDRVAPNLALELNSGQFINSGCWDEAYTVPQYWESNGFTNIGALEYLSCSLDVVLREAVPLILVDIFGAGPNLELCKDSLSTLKEFIDHLIIHQPQPAQPDFNDEILPFVNKLGTLDQSIHHNILDEIEEQAFGAPMLLPTPNPSRKTSTGEGVSRSYSSQPGLDYFNDFYASSPSVTSPRVYSTSSRNGDEADWLQEFGSPEDYDCNFGGIYERAIYTDSEPLQFIENYFIPFGEPESIHRWKNLDNCALRFRTLDISFNLKLYSGAAWSEYPHTSPATSPLSGLHHHNANLSKPTVSSMELQVTKLNLTYTKYLPESSEQASDFQLDVGKIEVIDQLATSSWRKFLTLDDESDQTPLDSSLPMIQFHFAQIAPKAMDSLEYQLKLEVLPIRLYIDQDALTFLTDFFTLSTDSSTTSELPAQENSINNTIYFRYAEIGSLKITVDYKPKHLNLSQLKDGHLAELANLFHLEDAQLKLNPVKFNGVDGVPKLLSKLTEAYLPHITSTQIPNVVAGVGPIRSLVNLGSGVADLILLPIQYYRRDGHLIRGLQKGVASFTRNATSEAIKVGASLAMGANTLLEQADHHLRAPTSSNIIPTEDRTNQPIGIISKYSQQPADVNQGVALAFGSLRRGLTSSNKLSPLYAVPIEVQEPNSLGKVRSVVKALPIALLQPMLISTEAVAMTLIGTLNWLNPQRHSSSQQKYKSKKG